MNDSHATSRFAGATEQPCAGSTSRGRASGPGADIQLVSIPTPHHCGSGRWRRPVSSPTPLNPICSHAPATRLLVVLSVPVGIPGRWLPAQVQPLPDSLCTVRYAREPPDAGPGKSPAKNLQ